MGLCRFLMSVSVMGRLSRDCEIYTEVQLVGVLKQAFDFDSSTYCIE